jgi:DNA modification methylase
MQYNLLAGDCIDILRDVDPDIFDSVVTDPPYNLSFMGKGWDTFGSSYQTWCEQWARECLRVLKPGGFLLAFGGTRTYHRLACAIEDSGFEIRDSLHWIYGSRFPKSRDISKAIDSEAGAEREVIGASPIHSRGANTAFPKRPGESSVEESGRVTPQDQPSLTAPATEAAKAWEGWGTALKPAHEPIVLARKPLAKNHTVAANVLKFGTGGLNIDGCRVGTDGGTSSTGEPNYKNAVFGRGMGGLSIVPLNQGRWPPNVLLTHSPDCELTGSKRVGSHKAHVTKRSPDTASAGRGAYGTFNGQENVVIGYGDADGMETVEEWQCTPNCPVAELDHQSGLSTSRKTPKTQRKTGKATDFAMSTSGQTHEDSGGASRFFPCFKYNAKASKKERPQIDGLTGHPTVKPLAVMQWLVRLVTPPNGSVLDLFAGTGTTAEACQLEGFNCVLIERDPESIRRIQVRMAKYENEDAA